jgi:DedD protein
MARPVSEEELQLKKRARRRLIGAIVLVCVVAVVLPMVFDSEPKRTSQEINIQIPSPDSKSVVSRVVPAPIAPSEVPAKGVKPKSVSKPSEMIAAPASTKTAENKAAKIEAAPRKAETGKPGNSAFYVQVIALADADRARQIQQQIVKAGLKSYTEVVVAEKGNVTRVRAGPFTSREEAEAAQKKLKAAGLDGKLGTR